MVMTPISTRALSTLGLGLGLGFGLALTAAPAAAQQAPAAPAAAQAPIAEAKIGFVFVSQLAGQSAHGKASQARIEALQQKKQAELGAKQKTLLDLQQKITAAASVAGDASRDQMIKEAERLNRDLERDTQDAQAELQALGRELQADFEKRLMPLIDQVAKEKGLHLVMSLESDGLLWHEQRLDITGDVMKRLDALK